MSEYMSLYISIYLYKYISLLEIIYQAYISIYTDFQ